MTRSVRRRGDIRRRTDEHAGDGCASDQAQRSHVDQDITGASATRMW
jgi:hypothetical protein